MRYFVIVYGLCALLLAGCNTPGQGMGGIAPTKVTLDGSRFDVRIKGDRGLAIRTNRQRISSVRQPNIKGLLAIEQVSGCRILPSTVVGDVIMVSARLACPSG